MNEILCTNILALAEALGGAKYDDHDLRYAFDCVSSGQVGESAFNEDFDAAVAAEKIRAARAKQIATLQPRP